MSEHGLTVFSPFKVLLLVSFTLLAWGDLIHGDQTALTAEILIIALYLNDLYIKRHQIAQARRLTFKEFLQQVKHDFLSFKLMGQVRNFFDRSTPLARKRFMINFYFAVILLSPITMGLMKLNDDEQSMLLTFALVIWSIWFIVSNLKAFWRTREVSRLLISNMGVYFLLCSLLLML